MGAGSQDSQSCDERVDIFNVNPPIRLRERMVENQSPMTNGLINHVYTNKPP